MKLIPFLAAFTVIITACSSDEYYPNPEIIELNAVKGFKSQLITDSILSEFFVLKLETPQGIFVGSIDKVIMTETRIFIADTKVLNSVFIFDEFGIYVNHLTGGNKGPQEFIRPQSITADFITNDLYVFDDKLQKIIMYDMNGSFISETRFKYTSNDIALMNNGKFAFNVGYPQIDNNVNSHDLIYVSESGKVESSFLPHRDWRIGSYFNKDNSFTQHKDNIWYAPVYNDTIYQLTQFGPKPIYHIEMGKDFIDDKLVSSIDLEDRAMEFNHAIGQFQKAGNVIYINYGINDKKTGRRVVKNVFIDVNSKNTKSGEYISGLGISNGLFRPPIASTGEHFVSTIDAFDAKRSLDWKFNDKEEIPEEITDLYWNLSENDNPLLLFYKVAPF